MSTTNTRRPLKGLLLYFWYSTGGKLILLFLQTIAWGIAFLVFGDNAFGPWLYALFGINAVMGVSLVIVMGMGNKEIDWERFQLSMPVRRRNMASSQFLSVGLAPFMGLPIFAIFSALSLLLHDGGYLFWHEGGSLAITPIFISIAPYLSMPYIMAGLIFPIYMIPAVEKIHDGLFPVIMVVSIAIPQLMVAGASRLEWSLVVASSLTLAVALFIFIVSYFITRKIYEKVDF